LALEKYMKNEYDVIVIGAGVVGCMVARWLARYQINILVIEKEADIGMGASSANSAIVHAGYDPVPGTLKAEMNVAANPMWDTLAGELNFGFDRRGDYVVAVNNGELLDLEKLLQQAQKNGVPGMHIITSAEMKHREPKINPDTTGALWAPTGGICDPFQVTIAAAENAIENGVTFLLETAFQDFILDGKKIIGIKTNHGDFKSRWVVNAAGIYSDEVMHKAGVRPEFKIQARRGEYLILDRADLAINNVLFPVPSEKGKGILVTATLHGNTIVGPNANVLPDKEDRSVSRDGMDELQQGAARLVPSLNLRSTIALFSGMRAYGNAPSENPGVKYDSDFIIEIPKSVNGLVNLGGIESPGLTAAPAIAQRVVDLMKDAGEKFVDRKVWCPIRPARPHFREMNQEEQIKLVKKDPRYGRIICRCENVTEGEIIAEMHAPIPARTYDAIKRRTWLGTGRCLGGFDMPRVVDILAKEMKVSPLEITKKGGFSQFLTGITKIQEGS
jgi:glycerol-3-phosphate dehydrogenase